MHKSGIISVFTMASTVVFTVLLLLKPDITLSAAYRALLLCGTNVIPALFPFFVCAQLFLSLHITNVLGILLRPIMYPLFRIRPEGALAFVVGIISGYPVGAKVTAELVQQGSVSRAEGERMLGFCNNSGPLFLLGAVGSGMLGNVKFGFMLYLAHFLSSITVGIALRVFAKPESNAHTAPLVSTDTKPFGALLGDAISQSANNIFMICGFVLLFQILLALLEDCGIILLLEHLFLLFHLPVSFARPLFYSIWEPTGGCRACADALAGTPTLCLMMISAAVGWSGFSVHLQVAAMVRHAGLRLHYYLFGKTLQSLLAPFYVFLLMLGSPEPIRVFAPQRPSAVPIQSLSRLCTFSVLYFLLGLLILFAFVLCFRCIRRRHSSLRP